ncbi:MAG: zinc-ribbon domain-containing protein, partial [Deltaproteobacteria bacterium]|nr:zinc-ribbon domain-containing protein [Deltaproteobacteria bacterium]
MRCVSCEFDNPDGMKFCTECGAPVRARCEQCGFDNPPRAKFCGECGVSLATHPPSSVSSSPLQVSSSQSPTPSTPHPTVV